MKFVVFTFLLFANVKAFAGDPFAVCPSNAFLMQGTESELYGVNLVSGSTSLLSDDLGTTERLNGIGFSVHDRYIYGWSYEYNGLVQIGNDYQVVSIPTTGFPDTNFYIGDVAVTENAFYVYRRGNTFGLYRVSLDAADPTYLQVTQVIDGDTLNINSHDIAFHPTDSNAYMVNTSGDLFQIDVSNGSFSNLGNVGQSGTFGAAYFDVNGMLYISRNNDGNIFIIDVAAATPTAQLFASGPSSGNNDGARCATAEIVDDDDVSHDYGDAPNTYLTSLGVNGARHEIGSLYLGPAITGEAMPNNPDPADDGISFNTALEAGFDSLVSVTASESGYIHAWIDFDASGTFEDSEKVLDGQAVLAGENRLLVAISDTAVAGNTWARFRLADNDTLFAYGGIANGEVEDYEVTISESGVTSIYYPSDSTYVTLAFEDKWPELGDYDFNDVVVQYRTQIDKVVDGASSQIKRYTISGRIVAVGATYRNAFAVRIQGLQRNQVYEELIRHEINDALQAGSVLEPARTEAILIAIPDTSTAVSIPDGCTYFRTEVGCTSATIVPFRVVVPLITPIDDSGLDSGVLDPFIFAVDNYYHGPIVDSSNGRAWEIHLKNQAPTEAFDTSYFNQNDDASDIFTGTYYQTSSGLPFGLEIGIEWSHPIEVTDLIIAYPSFVEFAESNGLLSPTWFNSPVADKVISN